MNNNSARSSEAEPQMLLLAGRVLRFLLQRLLEYGMKLRFVSALLTVATASAFLAAAPAAAEPKCDGPNPPRICDGEGGVGATPRPTTVSVTGSFTYQDGTRPRPIAFAEVEVWRFAPRILGIWAWGKDFSLTTDAAGRISARYGYDGPGIIYALRIFASNYAAVVWPNDAVHSEPFREQPGEPDGAPIQRTTTNAGQVMDFSYAFDDGWTPQHFNLADAIRHGYDFAVARRDPAESDPIPRVGVQPTSASGTWYNAPFDTIAINTTDVMNDLVALHEYSHFLEEQIGSLPWIVSSHDFCEATLPGGNVIYGPGGDIINSPELAWMEGFADWFAQAVARNNPGAGSSGIGGTPTVGQLESPGCGPSGDYIEGNVAGALWDLTDGPSAGEPTDNQSGWETTIFQIMDRELDVPPGAGDWPSMRGFRGAWLGRGLGAPTLDPILLLNNIPLPAPPQKPTSPSDEVCEEKPWTPGCDR
ncbi:hypothetical protein [Geodermatophilus sp. CPCC 205506]|uniref:hypothetical protein n=1 Tax=Geodermatophilus sp. CPCC 205506 TaxID=2936596 RepID=UPI003EEB9D9A